MSSREENNAGGLLLGGLLLFAFFKGFSFDWKLGTVPGANAEEGPKPLPFDNSKPIKSKSDLNKFINALKAQGSKFQSGSIPVSGLRLEVPAGDLVLTKVEEWDVIDGVRTNETERRELIGGFIAPLRKIVGFGTGEVVAMGSTNCHLMIMVGRPDVKNARTCSIAFFAMTPVDAIKFIKE